MPRLLMMIMSQESTPITDDFGNNFFMTRAGVVIPIVTGSISATFSFVIVSFILRSRINTIYHRIMFLLSFADIITSVAIALTTLPMPKDVIYPFAGPSYGNVQSCEIQGFLYLSGSSLTFSMNGILNLYYLCTMVFNIREVTFRRLIEPLLYIVCFTTCVVAPSVLLLQKDILNPSTVDPFCVASIYPQGCSNKQDNPDCRGASSGGADNFTICVIVALSASFLVLVVTMGSIFFTFAKREKEGRKFLHRSLRDQPQDYCEKESEWEEAQKNKRLISKQILMYIGAFVITWISAFLIVILRAQTNGWLQLSRMIFQPLQGFFNALIFFYHKVRIIRKVDEDKSVWDALRMLFGSPRETTEFVDVSNIEMVCSNYTAAMMFRISPGTPSSKKCMNSQQHIQAPCELHGAVVPLNQSSYLESSQEPGGHSLLALSLEGVDGCDDTSTF